MTLISFKDVGIKSFSSNNLRGVAKTIPFGIKTPLEIDTEGSNLFLMHYDIASQMDDNLRNVVLTNHGERLGLYTFGANLKPLLTEYSNKEDFDTEAMLRINTAVSIYLPFVTLIGFESKPDYENNRYTGKIKLTIMYSVPVANLNKRMIEVDLFVI